MGCRDGSSLDASLAREKCSGREGRRNGCLYCSLLQTEYHRWWREKFAVDGTFTAAVQQDKECPAIASFVEVRFVKAVQDDFLYYSDQRCCRAFLSRCHSRYWDLSPTVSIRARREAIPEGIRRTERLNKRLWGTLRLALEWSANDKSITDFGKHSEKRRSTWNSIR